MKTPKAAAAAFLLLIACAGIQSVTAARVLAGTNSTTTDAGHAASPAVKQQKPPPAAASPAKPASPAGKPAATGSSSSKPGGSGTNKPGGSVSKPGGSAAVLPAAVPWLPHKDKHGAWVEATNIAAVDFNSLTLMDLPSPKAYLEAMLLSPYATPKLPLERILENTMKQWAGGELPSSAQDWLQLARGGFDFFSTSLPGLVASLAPGANIEVDPKFYKFKKATDDTLSFLQNLPPLEAVGAELKAHVQERLSQLTNEVLGVDPETMAALVSSAVKPKPKQDLDSSWEEDTAAALAAVPKDAAARLVADAETTTTLADGKKQQQQAGKAAAAGSKSAKQGQQGGKKPKASFIDTVAEKITTLTTSEPVQQLLTEGKVNVPGLVREAVMASTDMPAAPPLPEVLMDLSSKIPAVAKNLGIDTDQINLDSAVDVIQDLVKAADDKGMFLTNSQGNVDVIASLFQLPGRLPDLQEVVVSAVPAAAALPELLGRAATALNIPAI